MSWDNKVVWNEGLFLQPQHLQQQERYLDRLIRASTQPLRPFAWGLTSFDLDSDLLTLGKFAVRAIAGILPDGTPFSVPGDANQPRPLDLPDNARNVLVYLSLPTRQPGAVETAPADMTETVARYVTDEHDAIDINAGYQSTASLPIGKLRLRFALEYEERSGNAEIGLARIIEMRADKSVVIDEGYIPSTLVCGASQVLTGFVSQVQGLIHHRAEALGGRVSETANRGAAEFADFLLLQLCNKSEPVLAHLASIIGQVHPETVFQYLASLAGELATFTEARKRAPAFPPYRHEDLQATFRPVMSSLRQSLSAVLEQTAVPIPLQERKFGIRVAAIQDRSLVTAATWVLVVTAQMPAETLRYTLPNQIKIGPVEQIRELINVALPGIPIRALPVAPRQLPYYSGASYFEFDRNNPYWAMLAQSGGVAIHLSGDFPGINIECWAIRG